MLLELLEAESTDYRLFVDLDGVLVDFIRGVNELLPGYSEERYESDPEFRSLMWNLINQHEKDGGEFWYELTPTPDAGTLWQYVSQYNPEVLTATGSNNTTAGDQKKRWVRSYVGSKVKVNVTVSAREKAQYAAPNHILIDDKEKAIGPWIAAGGIGILHTNAEDTIRQLKRLGL